MADLAQAIVSLARSSEKRRGARAELMEATDTIAQAIRKELRAGDKVDIPDSSQAESLVSWTGYVPKVSYYAARVRPDSIQEGAWKDALLRGTAILGVSDAQGRYQWEAGDSKGSAAAASAEERQAFVAEAEAVIKAFQAKVEQQAQDYDRTSKQATKLTPR